MLRWLFIREDIVVNVCVDVLIFVERVLVVWMKSLEMRMEFF